VETGAGVWQLPRARIDLGDIRRDELAAAEDSERPAHFQRPAIPWNLD